MPFIARDSRKTFAVPDEGLHQAVCCDLVDLGLVETGFGKKHQVEVRWQLEDVNPETGTRFVQRQRYTLSLNEKAKLRQHLETWRGRKFSKDEIEDGFDLERLLGANCQLQTVHNLGDDGRVWSNVASIVPLGKGMAKMTVTGYVREKDKDAQAEGNGAEATGEEIPF